MKNRTIAMKDDVRIDSIISEQSKVDKISTTVIFRETKKYLIHITYRLIKY